VSDSTDTGQSKQDGERADRESAADDTPEDGGLAAAVRPEIPAVSVDTTSDAADGDELAAAVRPDTGTRSTERSVDPELGRLFWKLVGLYKVTLLGGTLGVLLVVFEPGPAIGPELVGGAVVLLVYTLYLTRQTRRRIDAGEFHEVDDPATDPQAGTQDDLTAGDPQTGNRSDPATDPQAGTRGES
jgi:hypothetical protein